MNEDTRHEKLFPMVTFLLGEVLILWRFVVPQSHQRHKVFIFFSGQSTRKVNPLLHYVVSVKVATKPLHKVGTQHHNSIGDFQHHLRVAQPQASFLMFSHKDLHKRRSRVTSYTRKSSGNSNPFGIDVDLALCLHFPKRYD
jgi:hypothetical protein